MSYLPQANKQYAAAFPTVDNCQKRQCDYRAKIFPGQPQVLPCKNGKPYDGNCDLIQEPYSMPFESINVPSQMRCVNPGRWYMTPPYFVQARKQW